MGDVTQLPPRNPPPVIEQDDEMIFTVSRKTWETLPLEIWQCNCRGQLFYLNRDGPRCASCGLFAQSWIDWK